MGTLLLATSSLAPLLFLLAAPVAPAAQSALSLHPTSGSWTTHHITANATEEIATAAAGRDTVLTVRPAYAPNGQIVLELRSDLWLVPDPAEPARLVRLTTGAARDVEPAWTADGRAVIFASDRNGAFHLWRIPVNSTGATGEAVQLTRGAEGDREPAVAPDGSIIFVRGRGTAAQLWVRRTDGTERQFTSEPGGARMPAISPDGSQVAYSAVREGRRLLRLRPLTGPDQSPAAGPAAGTTRTLASDFAAEHPAWSPDGERIAFTTARGRAGVWVVAVADGYPNLVSARYARPAWRPDGERLLLAALPREELGYNGDPDRAVDRGIADPLPYAGRLWLVDAPRAPDGGLVEVALEPPAAPADFVAGFDRIWGRIDQLYYSGPAAAERRARWVELAEKYRPQARVATDAAALERIIHALLQERPPYREEATGRAGVSSAHPLATAAGLEILQQGGNVVDAAIAVSFAVGVVEPDASGIGGYGQMLVHLKGMAEPVLIEFMSRTPEAAVLGNPALADAAGPMLANIPGTVDGMWRTWERFGSKKLTWAELLAPAIRLAEEGFVLDDAFPTTLARERENFLRYDGSRALFFPDGQPLQPGDTLRNPDLAWTLREIAAGGADAFYRGEIARRMVEDLAAGGNVMTLNDMDRYYAAWRDPIRGTYRGHTIYSSAPPVSGGATLVAQLNLLERFSRPRLPADDGATAHAMIEAWKLVPSGRIADPGLWPVDLEPYLSKDTAAARWGCFSADSVVVPQALARAGCARPASEVALLGAGSVLSSALVDASVPAAAASVPEEELDCESGAAPYSVRECVPTGTTTFAVADAEGNMVSVTQTLGTWGGNFYVTPGLGFLYNDKLNSYGRNPAGYGARLPNARHGSTIAPTLVFRGTGAAREPLFATGAAGNAWITSAVYQLVTGMIDHGLGPQQALEQPRFLLSRQAGPGGGSEVVIQYEYGYAPDLVDRLRKLGHRLQPITFQGELRMGYGAAVLIEGGQVRAGGDPRRSGAGGAVR